MARKNAALTALKKLESDQAALSRKREELEAQAALDIGSVILGTGLEEFSHAGLKRTAIALGKLGEDAALAKLASKSG